MVVEFRLLGSVETHLDRTVIDIGPPRQRCVLVALLVETNQVVSPDQLVDRVWGDRVPYRARETLRTYLTRLRRALTATDKVEIGRRSGGYVLTVDPFAVDLHRFRQLATGARAAEDDAVALDLFEQARRLWRGEAFAGLDTPWINSVRNTLEAERVAVELDHTDVRLGRGQHHELLAELAAQASARPLDERLTAQLILALYRCGRQADALDHYQRTRSRLVEEIGADPSPPLRRLHQQVLTADPALSVPRVEVASMRSPVPRQLPAAPRLFTGRADELAQLDKVLDRHGAVGSTVMISAIGGIGGIGKTWLALHWAHQNLDRFPDGQLQVNLRGFDPAGEPTPPQVAVRGFLDALGVDPARIPMDMDAQAALYRSLVAGRRMLIVLDNARATEQVEPLLPGSPTCIVLVTSRHQLTSLVVRHGAHPLDLDVLSEAESRKLFTRHIGADRVAAEPDAVTALLGWCAGLPLAISIVAARAARHVEFPLAVLAGELRDESARLDTLDGGELTVDPRAIFSWSYRALDRVQAEVFGLLSLAPGPDISLSAAASLVDLPNPRARTVLGALEDASLIQQHFPSRYRLHDLLRLYATEQAHHDQPDHHRDAALRRLADFYLHTAHTGERLLNPHRPPIEIDSSAAGRHPHRLEDQVAALAWFEAELPCLLATQRLAATREWYGAVWRLAWTLDTFHVRRGRLLDHVTLWRMGLAAAQHEGDPTTLLHAYRSLGRAYSRVGMHTEAIDHLERALDLARDTGDLVNQAHTHRALAWAWELLGDDQRALEHATDALHLFQTLKTPALEADMLNAAGWLHARLGNYPQARTHCETALALCRRHQYREGEAHTLDSLGYLAYHSEQHTQALGYYQQAVDLFRDISNTYEEADTLERLGQAHSALGDHDQARHAWRRALELFQAQNRAADVERVAHQLDDIDERC